MPTCTLVGVGGRQLGGVFVESVEEYAAGGPRRDEIPIADEILVHCLPGVNANMLLLQHKSCNNVVMTTTVS